MAIERSGPITGTIAIAGTASGTVDLGKVYEDVVIRFTAAHAANLGAASANSLQASRDGTNWFPVYAEDLSAVESFTKPASGGVHATFLKANARYVRLASSVAAIAETSFTAEGFKEAVYTPALERITIP